MSGRKLTEARRKTLQEIADGHHREGVRPVGPRLTLAHGFLAWGWVQSRHVSGFMQRRYFITEAGRCALAQAEGAADAQR